MFNSLRVEPASNWIFPECAKLIPVDDARYEVGVRAVVEGTEVVREVVKEITMSLTM